MGTPARQTFTGIKMTHTSTVITAWMIKPRRASMRDTSRSASSYCMTINGVGITITSVPKLPGEPHSGPGKKALLMRADRRIPKRNGAPLRDRRTRPLGVGWWER
jgi:hypothetical protein